MRDLLIGAALLALTGCAQHPPVVTGALGPGADATPVELADTAFHPQEAYQCGPAALATVLGASGTEVSPDTLTAHVFIPGRRGSLQVEMIAATRRHGRIPYLTDPTIVALLSEVRAGRPVLVFQNLGIDALPVWHYAVVIGYSPADDTLVLRSGTERRHVVPAREFMRTWDGGNRWAMVVLAPGELPARPDRHRYLEAVATAEQVIGAGPLLPAYSAALSRWPDDPVALFGVGNARYARGDHAGAEAAYRHALRVQPRHAAAANNLADVLAARGCFDEALATVDTALADAAGGSAVEHALRQTRDEIRAAKGVRPAATAGCGPLEETARK